MTCAFSNLPKFLDNPGNAGSTVSGKVGSMLPPGREVEGGINSRSVLWYSLTGMVSAQSQAQEAAYLLLQWLGSARIYAWMSANPGGYLDPFRLSDFNDPLVNETYHEYHISVLRETVARTVPTINYPGATAFHNALDENLMAALTGAKTSEQAMEDTAGEWERIVRRTGEEKVVDAIQKAKAAWPTIIDPIS
jgi:multiple sugar transport system substrate-binding protein